MRGTSGLREAEHALGPGAGPRRGGMRVSSAPRVRESPHRGGRGGHAARRLRRRRWRIAGHTAAVRAILTSSRRSPACCSIRATIAARASRSTPRWPSTPAPSAPTGSPATSITSRSSANAAALPLRVGQRSGSQPGRLWAAHVLAGAAARGRSAADTSRVHPARAGQSRCCFTCGASSTNRARRPGQGGRLGVQLTTQYQHRRTAVRGPVLRRRGVLGSRPTRSGARLLRCAGQHPGPLLPRTRPRSRGDRENGDPSQA